MKNRDLTPRQQHVYRIVASLARKCVPLPTESELSALAGIPTGAAKTALEALEIKGVVSISRLSKNVHILTDNRTGFSTARPDQMTVLPDDIGLRVRPLSHVPCPYCGVRPDVPCKHRKMA